VARNGQEIDRKESGSELTERLVTMDDCTQTAPTVSVVITAFNSESWIERAISSVLQQEISFPIEIIIADDCSTDGTAVIAKRFSEEHSDKVRLILRDKNVGIQRNYYESFGACSGKYIAWLDADDYWTDPSKLAIQVQLLEKDPTISVCAHVVHWVDLNGEIKKAFPRHKAGRYGMKDILQTAFLPTPSVVFRNGIQKDLPNWYLDIAPVTDWPLWILAVQSGDILLLDRVMAHYQLRPQSAGWGQGLLQNHLADARFYEHVESILPPRYHRLARSEKGKRYESIAHLLRNEEEDFVGSRSAAWKAFCSPYWHDNLASKIKSLALSSLQEMAWRIRH
jgi:glycosyltransferase involved in cell wall biosynthesis